MPTPIPDPDGSWPACDDEQPGISIRPLSHADLAALLDHLHDHDHDQDLDEAPAWPGPPAPVVAARVRASVGRPGASAEAQYRRRRAGEWAAWTRSLPWRVAAVLTAGAIVGLLAAQVAPPLAGPAGLLAAAALAWALRFRLSPETDAWRRGAAGERRTARLLGRLEQRGWVVLHDLAIPGSAANIDHLAIGPGGVVVIDSKQYRGRLQLSPEGLLWHGRHPLSLALHRVRWEADQADQVLGIADVQVAAFVAVHGAHVPWGRVVASGVTVAPADRVPDLLRALPRVLAAEQVGWLADRARLRFHSAASAI
jgi:Nuclease-related domain